MKILISGSSGLIGSHLSAYLSRRGHIVSHLIRDRNKILENNIWWDPEKSEIDPVALEGYHAVIHLGGENIASRRWTSRQKQRIKESRVRSTQLLARTMGQLKLPPYTFICASATGYYGDRGDEEIKEDDQAGKGFLADVVREWEAATEPAKMASIRVINCRFGVILTTAGGVLARTLPLFRFGLGGRIGNGKQYTPWITLEDVLPVVEFILQNKQITGPVNVVAPQSVTNSEYTKTLARVLERPHFLSIPGMLIKAVLGEMGDELLLTSTRAVPAVLIDNGYPFTHPLLKPALESICRKYICSNPR
jgi:uncharacterized protein (TIGR01777 family)